MVRNRAAVLHDLLFAAANFSTEPERGRYTEVGTVVHGAHELENFDEGRLAGWREGACDRKLAWAQPGRKTVRSREGRADERLVAGGDVEKGATAGDV